MEALMKAINDILKEKDTSITLLKFKNGQLEKELEELKKALEKYKENEVK